MTNGFSVVQSGSDVKTAPDYEYVATTRWPILQVIKESKFVLTPGGEFKALIHQHNLDYYTPFILLVKRPDGSYSSPRPPSFLGESSTLSPNIVKIHRDGLYYDSESITTDIDIYYYIFDYNLEENFDAGAIGVSDTRSTAESHYGIQSPNFDKTDSLRPGNLDRDNVNTKGRPLSVHKNNRFFAPGTTTPIIIDHNLGYLPTYLFYKELPGGGLYSESGVRILANNNSLTFRGAQSVLSGHYYYLIAKEPLALAI